MASADRVTADPRQVAAANGAAGGGGVMVKYRKGHNRPCYFIDIENLVGG
jgi:hypothetical protein